MKFAKKVLLVVTALAVLVIAWYTVGRLGHWLRPVETLTFEGSVAPDRAPDRAPDHWTIASYNIAHGRGGVFGASNWQGHVEANLRPHLEAIGRQIRAADADVVVLNETDFDSTWSLGIDQARVIADTAGYRHVAEQPNYGVAIPFLSYRFGNAILSRYPLRDVRRIDCPPLSTAEDVLAGNHDAMLAVVEAHRRTCPSRRKIPRS